MGQIDFIRHVISETLSLGAQFRFNWENWNFRGPNLIFTKLVDSNQGKITRKSKFWGSIRD
jgi:hypothetical protein